MQQSWAWACDYVTALTASTLPEELKYCCISSRRQPVLQALWGQVEATAVLQLWLEVDQGMKGSEIRNPLTVLFWCAAACQGAQDSASAPVAGGSTPLTVLPWCAAACQGVQDSTRAHAAGGCTSPASPCLVCCSLQDSASAPVAGGSTPLTALLVCCSLPGGPGLGQCPCCGRMCRWTSPRSRSGCCVTSAGLRCPSCTGAAMPEAARWGAATSACAASRRTSNGWDRMR